MLLMAIPGFVLAILMMATLREPTRHAGRGGGGGAAMCRCARVIQHLLSLQVCICSSVVAICFSLLVEFGLNQWLPSYYVRAIRDCR